MKKIILIAVLIIGATILFFNNSCNSPKQSSYKMPDGWMNSGGTPTRYAMGKDNSTSYDGKYSATIKSIVDKIDGFGTFGQFCDPDKYLGKRIRMTGYMKTKNVNDWAGFWLRVDADSDVVSFDNMHDGKKNKSVKGTTNWTKYEIVLDVPSNATLLVYGALLAGSGQIWFDNLSFEIVDNTVETTGYLTPTTKNVKKSTMRKPSYNLSFER